MKKSLILLFVIAFIAASGMVFADNGHGNHGGNGGNGGNHGGQWGDDHGGQWGGNHGGQWGGGDHGGWGCGNTVPEPVSTALFLLGGATLAVRRIRKNK